MNESVIEMLDSSISLETSLDLSQAEIEKNKHQIYESYKINLQVDVESILQS